MWTALLITAAIASLVQTGITYPPYALQRGWPIGHWATGNGWYVYHGFAALSVLFAAWKYGGLIGLPFVVILGFVGAFIIVYVSARGLR